MSTGGMCAVCGTWFLDTHMCAGAPSSSNPPNDYPSGPSVTVSPDYKPQISITAYPCPLCGDLIAQGVAHVCPNRETQFGALKVYGNRPPADAPEAMHQMPPSEQPVSRAEFDALRADVYRLLEHAGMPK